LEKAEGEGRQPTEEEWGTIKEQYNLSSLDDAKNAGGRLYGVVAMKIEAHRNQGLREIKADAVARAGNLRSSGFAAISETGALVLSADVSDVVKKSLGAGSGKMLAALQKQLDVTDAQTQYGQGGSSAGMHADAAAYGQANLDIMSYTPAQQRKLARDLEKKGIGSEFGAQLQGYAAQTEKVQRQINRGGEAYALGSVLGVKFKSKKQLQGLRDRAASGDTVGTAQELLNMSGLSSEERARFSDDEMKELGGMLNTKTDKGKRIQDLGFLATGTSGIGRKLQEVQTEHEKKKSEAQDREKNPLMDKIENHLDDIQATLNAHLGEIATNTKTTAGNTATKQPDVEKVQGQGAPGQLGSSSRTVTAVDP
jgi:hypothetical protein